MSQLLTDIDSQPKSSEISICMASSCDRLRAFSNLLLSLLLAVVWFLTDENCVFDKKILQQNIF